MTPSPPHPAYRSPGNYASGAASLSPPRLQRRTPHRRSGQNRPLDHRSSNKIAAAVVPLPPTTPVNASPAQAPASSNPHSHQPPTRRPAGSLLGGFRTPALRARANDTTGPASETLHLCGHSPRRQKSRSLQHRLTLLRSAGKSSAGGGRSL